MLKFMSVIDAISRSGSHKIAKGLWAQRVFQRIEDLHAEGLVPTPSIPVMNALLNALVSSNESDALSRAESLF